ncbi:MAG: DNA translocase FtsK [Actinobacteria bacterium]|nr:DNA translocase FtsK [Actinomycetota bacterium]
MPATAPKPRTKTPARRGSTTRRSTPRKPSGRGRGSGYREIAGLGLIALGVFLGAVVFASIGGGASGRYLEEFIRMFVGRGVGLAPLVMVAVGVHLIVRVPVFDARPFRIGAGLVALAILLGLASGLFGAGIDTAQGWFDMTEMQATGGVIGAGLWWATDSTIGAVGANILTVLGIAAGMVLMSGASLGEALRGSGRGVATAGAAVGRGVATATNTAVRGSRRAGDEAKAIARTVAAPTTRRDADDHPVDGADRYPDIFAAGGHMPPSPALAGAGIPEDDDEPMPFGADEAHDVFHDPIDGDGADGVGSDVFTPVELPMADAPDDAPGHHAPAAAAVGAHEADIHGAPGASPRGGWKRPPKSSLRKSAGVSKMPAGQVRETSRRLVEALAEFGVQADMVNAVSGPRVTRYELRLAPGTKVSKVSSLRDDLAYALAATDELRILAPIPGKQAVGVEVPNPDASVVTLGDIWRDFPDDTGALAAWLGLDIGGKAVYLDIARMPHILIAGSTGTGKSVCVNGLLASILLRATPNQLRLVMIDPKKVELNHYEGIPHLLTPVVTNMKNATAVLANIVREMESRYEVMGAARARNLKDWNAIRREQGLSEVPPILVVIDELADLMMVAPGEVEDAIIRIAQKARAVGIHLLLATQRPSVDVITGMIKANVPSRIAFAVSSQVDSRVVLDSGGAESLLGNGDMLFRPVGSSRLQRLQGAYVSEEEILVITDHWRRQGAPEIREDLMERPDVDGSEVDAGGDEMLRRAVDTVVQQGTASVSLLQRRLGVGYARAGRLVDSLERLGVISGHEGSKPRAVLIGEADIPRVLGIAAADAGVSRDE